MQLLFELLPWIVFGLTYKFAGGLYPATAALMISMAVLLLLDWLTQRQIPKSHLILALLIWVFGAATLLLHDARLLQWKASVFYWIGGLVFAGSAFIGRKTVLERVLGKALPEGSEVPAASWRNATLVIGAFYLLLGAVNLWIAMNRDEATWVTFKVWVAGPVALVVTMLVGLWPVRKVLFSAEEKP